MNHTCTLTFHNNKNRHFCNWVKDDLRKQNAFQSNAMGKCIYTLPVAVKVVHKFWRNTLDTDAIASLLHTSRSTKYKQGFHHTNKTHPNWGFCSLSATISFLGIEPFLDRIMNFIPTLIKKNELFSLKLLDLTPLTLTQLHVCSLSHLKLTPLKMGVPPGIWTRDLPHPKPVITHSTPRLWRCRASVSVPI